MRLVVSFLGQDCVVFPAATRAAVFQFGPPSAYTLWSILSNKFEQPVQAPTNRRQRTFLLIDHENNSPHAELIGVQARQYPAFQVRVELAGKD